MSKKPVKTAEGVKNPKAADQSPSGYPATWPEYLFL